MVNLSSVDYSIYLVTESGTMEGDAFCNAVEEAIRGGVSIVQLREKNCSTRKFYELACRIRQVTAYHDVPFIVNDRLDIALAVGADGLHVGGEDLPAGEARRLLGDRFILGVTASTVEDAVAATAAGADYIGSGAIHATPTKPDKPILPLSELVRIRSAVHVPVVAIGGITLNDIGLLRETGVAGVAVVKAIMGANDPKAAANILRAAWDRKLQDR